MENNKSDDATSSWTTVETPTITLRILEDLASDSEQDDVEEAVGRLVWPTARPLLRHILSLGDLQSWVVVELGAGCGVLGMGLAASPTHTSRVILTDHDSDWLQQNVALNEQVLEQANAWTTIEVARLDWRNPQDIATVQTRIQELIRNRNNNHNDNNPQLTIVASDVLYNHHSHKALASTLWQLQKPQSTRIIMAFPDRDDDEQSFLPCARELFGEYFPASKPLPIVTRNIDKPRRKRQMDLRLIDFTVP